MINNLIFYSRILEKNPYLIKIKIYLFNIKFFLLNIYGG